MIFFFKQKTAYEMRISDWSSDVCSSDLDGEELPLPHRIAGGKAVQHQRGARLTRAIDQRRPHRADRELILRPGEDCPDRKSVVKGKSVSVRVDTGGRRTIQKTTLKI